MVAALQAAGNPAQTYFVEAEGHGFFIALGGQRGAGKQHNDRCHGRRCVACAVTG